MDADVTGPSIPKAFGLHGMLSAIEGVGIEPAIADNGIKVVSMNLLLEDEEAPVVWRGPVVAGVLQQFWKDVDWGKVDYMFVDMPPGTGDVPLSIYQSLPVDGIIVVTTPQDLVQLIVTKAFKMAQMMNVPILGVIENMSYMECPDCGKKLNVFGESKAWRPGPRHHADPSPDGHTRGPRQGRHRQRSGSRRSVRQAQGSPRRRSLSAHQLSKTKTCSGSRSFIMLTSTNLYLHV